VTAAPRAVVLVTGDEVLRGRVSDRNGAHLSRRLDAAGVHVEAVSIIGDRLDGIRDAVGAALSRGIDLICTTGGLGPTHDDLTMAAVAAAAGRDLPVDPTALAMVEGRSAGIDAGPASAERTRRKQASLPFGASVIPPAGTAPGCVLTVGSSVIVVLPGPPWELRAMWEAVSHDDPALVALLGRASVPDERIVRIHGIGESRLVEVLEERGAPAAGGLMFGVCAKDAELELTLRGDATAADRLLNHLVGRLGDGVFSSDGTTLDALIASTLTRRGETVAVAESCTGGALGARLTAATGASAFMRGGIIAYSNAIKRDLLGVEPGLLDRHGAVSAECAAAMADGARAALGSTWALSVTGIAGPGGGGPGKPVGLVYLGRGGPTGTVVEEHRFRGDRDEVRRRSLAAALHLLRKGL
jgi:nicotinamide-nucleotide amidase